MSINKVILTGRLGKNVDVRYTQQGKAVASFSLAVDSGYGDKKHTDWIDIVAWGKMGEVCGNCLSKGSKIGVVGRLSVRSYDAKDGSKRYVTEVVASDIEFLDSKEKFRQNNFKEKQEQDEEIPF